MSGIVIPFTSEKKMLTLDAEEINPSDNLNNIEDSKKPVDNPGMQPNYRTMTDLTRQEVDAKIAASEAKLDARLANFDTSVKTGFAELRADMAKMQSEVHKGTAELIKWGAGFAVTIVVATVGLLTFINKTADKPPSNPVPAQAPIVIYAQPAPAAEPQFKQSRPK